METPTKLRNISLETLNPFDTMPVIIDYSTDRLYLQGSQDAMQKTRKEDIKKLLLSKKLTIQEIAQILDVPLEMVKEIETNLKK